LVPFTSSTASSMVSNLAFHVTTRLCSTLSPTIQRFNILMIV
jgi:hypothetical protein